MRHMGMDMICVNGVSGLEPGDRSCIGIGHRPNLLLKLLQDRRSIVSQEGAQALSYALKCLALPVTETSKAQYTWCRLATNAAPVE